MSLKQIFDRAGLIRAYQDVFRREGDGSRRFAPPVERVLKDLVRFCDLDRPALRLLPGEDGQALALRAAFNEGRQEVLRHIFTQIHADEDLLKRVEHMQQIQQEARLNV